MLRLAGRGGGKSWELRGKNGERRVVGSIEKENPGGVRKEFCGAEEEALCVGRGEVGSCIGGCRRKRGGWKRTVEP